MGADAVAQHVAERDPAAWRRRIGYVMAVACSTPVRINSGPTPVRTGVLAGRLPADAWQRHSAGAGAKGPRHYDWAWVHMGTDSHHHLLVRRNRTTGELAFHRRWFTHHGGVVGPDPPRRRPLEHGWGDPSR